MDNEKDEFDAIFVDKNEPIDKKLIVEILKTFVTIDNEGVINFTEEYDKLKDNKKALIYLVCRKAMVLREIDGINEPIGPIGISREAHVSESNVKHAIFRDYKKILKKEGKGYIIPNYNLKKVKELVLKGVGE